jgi:predicted dehydrogenase
MSNSVIDEVTGVDMHGSFYFIFPNDKVSLCSFGYENVYLSTYSVWGLKSLISVDRAFSINPNKDSTILMKFDDRIETISIPWVNQSMIMIDEFSTSILDKSKCYAAYEEDLLSQARAMEGIRISSKEKRFVKLDEIK